MQGVRGRGHLPAPVPREQMHICSSPGSGSVAARRAGGTGKLIAHLEKDTSCHNTLDANVFVWCARKRVSVTERERERERERLGGVSWARRNEKL